MGSSSIGCKAIGRSLGSRFDGKRGETSSGRAIFATRKGVERQLSLTKGSSQAVGENPVRPQASVEKITGGLRTVLRNGVRPAQLRHCRELLELWCVRERAGGSDEPDRLAFGLEDVLRAAIDALGDGPQGQAAELLFGAAVDTRGLPLKDRRRQAAGSLHVAVSTFRQNYEDQMVEDVAAEVLRLELVAGPAS